MRYWIKKENDKCPTGAWSSSSIICINRKEGRTAYSNIYDSWYHVGSTCVDAVYEDVFVIGLSVFALDKRISRKDTFDGWTRDISVSIPVIEYEKWKNTEEDWKELLSFLTGDNWNVEFRETDKFLSKRKNKTQKKKYVDITKTDTVCLFSGGLDSFCGAIKLMSEGKNPILIGHNEYPKLRQKQTDFCEAIRREYNSNAVFIDFTANSHKAKNKNGDEIDESENTSRGRSLLFLCAALSFASILGNIKNTSIPVYIPENGFIGINVPLTDNRMGSCTTRTTHPAFIKMFKDVIKKVGIQNEIINPFQYMSKRTIVKSVIKEKAFLDNYENTISCSHPTNAKYGKTGDTDYPKNCGYCYPCIIRASSLLDVDDKTNYSYGFSEVIKNYKNFGAGTSNDFYAMLSSIYRYLDIKNDDKEIEKLVRLTGPLLDDEVYKFISVYKDGMNDVIELFGGEDKVKGLF